MFNIRNPFFGSSNGQKSGSEVPQEDQEWDRLLSHAELHVETNLDDWDPKIVSFYELKSNLVRWENTVAIFAKEVGPDAMTEITSQCETARAQLRALVVELVGEPVAGVSPVSMTNQPT